VEIKDLPTLYDAWRPNATLLETAVPSKRVDAEQQKRQTLGSNALDQEKVQRGLFLPD
jgi:hypothetical protein